MDEQTSLVLALQLVALCCIACALVLYLLCRIKARPPYSSADMHIGLGLHNSQACGAEAGALGLGLGLAGRAVSALGAGRPVLVTCCETTLGLQLAMHLSNVGFRVFAGLKKGVSADGESPGSDSTGPETLCARLLRAHAKQLEALFSAAEGAEAAPGSLVLVPMDVTREDVLHDAVDVIRRHLPAGHDGLHAVINSAGLCSRGRLEAQENSQWDALLKVNVVGTLRTARTFLPLLRNKQGRLLNLGASGAGASSASDAAAGSSTGLVAYTAARYAVEGATNALRAEMSPLGVSVISLQPPEGAAGELLFLPPSPRHKDSRSNSSTGDLDVQVQVNALGGAALRVVEEALLTAKPKARYQLPAPAGGGAPSTWALSLPLQLPCAWGCRSNSRKDAKEGDSLLTFSRAKC